MGTGTVAKLFGVFGEEYDSESNNGTGAPPLAVGVRQSDECV